MTIRMLQAWNGLHQQKIVTTLSGSDEAALVAAGIATYDLDGPAENLRMAQLATDAGGRVAGLSDPVDGGTARRKTCAWPSSPRMRGAMQLDSLPGILLSAEYRYSVGMCGWLAIVLRRSHKRQPVQISMPQTASVRLRISIRC